MAIVLGSAVCSLAQDHCIAASTLGLLSSITAWLPAHHLHTSSEMGKLARGKKRAIFIPLLHTEAVPSFSKKYRGRAKKASSSSLTHRPS